MISDKAVEVAAEEIFNSARGGNDPRTLTEAKGELSEWISKHARAALQAALPVLLEGNAEEIARVIREAIEASPNADVGGIGYDDDAKMIFSYVDIGELDLREIANRIISILTGESDER